MIIGKNCPLCEKGQLEITTDMLDNKGKVTCPKCQCEFVVVLVNREVKLNFT